MKILLGNAIKQADLYTIENEPIRSIDLMERASMSIAQHIAETIDKQYPLLFIVGKGNNGGDGFAVARILYHWGYEADVFNPFSYQELSEDSRINFDRLPLGIKQKNSDDFKQCSQKTVIIDALLGTGVKGTLNEPLRSLIELINSCNNRIISIDLPSGMKTEFGNKPQEIVKAERTITLEFPKLAMLLPEAGECCGQIVVIAIGLNHNFIQKQNSPFSFLTHNFIRKLKKKRLKFAHKGTYGHALLICGSAGMIGAAILATGAALRSGCGLVTTHLPADERFSLQTSYPSALLSLDEKQYFSKIPKDIDKYSSIGIGCGLGQSDETILAFEKLLQNYKKPMLIDADALNILSKRRDLFTLLPPGSILSPHPKELERLLGKWSSEEEKIELVRALARTRQLIIIVKGAHSMIFLPSGDCYFNSTGNAGMAKGGSGDVLSGLISGLLARGYCGKEAALLGVYYHGQAGDKAEEKRGKESMNSQDIIHFLQLDEKSF